jgi:hypothetical protein
MSGSPPDSWPPTIPARGRVVVHPVVVELLIVIVKQNSRSWSGCDAKSENCAAPTRILKTASAFFAAAELDRRLK